MKRCESAITPGGYLAIGHPFLSDTFNCKNYKHSILTPSTSVLFVGGNVDNFGWPLSCIVN